MPVLERSKQVVDRQAGHCEAVFTVADPRCGMSTAFSHASNPG